MTRLRPLLAILVFVLAALGVALMLEEPERPAPGPAAGDGVLEGAPERPVVAPALDANADGPEAASERSALAGARGGVEPIEFREPEQALARGEGMLVRVIQQDSREPLAGARVLFLDESVIDIGTLERAFLAERSYRNIFERFGRVFVTDESGETVVPHTQADAMLFAHRGLIEGVHQVFEPQDETTILVQRVQQVLARVSDEAGRPVAGVPVALRMSLFGQSFDTLGGVTAAPRGIAAITGIETLHSNAISESGQYQVVITLPLAEEVTAEVDPFAPPPDPVELVLPPTGRVEVALLDPDGTPYDTEFRVALRVAGDEEPSEHVPDFSESGVTSQISVDGVANFPHVGVGVALDVLVWTDERGVLAAERHPGVTASGATLSLELTASPPFPVLVGVAQDDRGTALASRRVALTLVEGESEFPFRVLTTTDEGAFAVPLETLPDDEGVSDSVLRFRCEREEGADLVGELRLRDVPLRAGDVDVGRVTLRVAPLVVAGRVVDAAGAGVPHAHLRIERQSFWGPEPENFHWEEGARFHTADAEGSFEIREAPVPEQARLVVRASGFATRKIAFMPGLGGLRVVLEAEARLAGSVLLDEPRWRDHLVAYLDLQPVELDELQLPDEHYSVIDEQNEFRWDKLPAATADFRLEMRRTDQVLFEVDGLSITSGVENRDPRLQEIDLRDRLRMLAIEAQDPDGRPLANFQVWVRMREDAEHWSPYGGRNGRVEVPIFDDFASAVHVGAEGFRSRILRDVTVDQRVRLQRSGTIRLRVDGLPTAEELGFPFVVQATLEAVSEVGEDLPQDRFATVELDATGAAVLHVRGETTLHLKLTAALGSLEEASSFYELPALGGGDVHAELDGRTIEAEFELRISVDHDAVVRTLRP